LRLGSVPCKPYVYWEVRQFRVGIASDWPEHMNGRIFDPITGRFLSADSHVTDPSELQSYNRYSYCWNSPMLCTDPSGYDLVGFLSGGLLGGNRGGSIQDIFNPMRVVFRNVSYETGTILNGIGSLFCGPGLALCYTAGSYDNAREHGADVFQAASGAVQAGVIAWASQAASESLGGATGHNPDFGSLEYYENVAGHAAIGCAASVAGDGDCRSGALSGGVSAALNPVIRGVVGIGQDFTSKAERTSIAAIIGGTASVIGGGKFANGAVTAAFAHAYNAEGRDRSPKLKMAPYLDDKNAGGASYFHDGPIAPFAPELDLLAIDLAIVRPLAGATSLAFSGGADSVFWSGYDFGALSTAKTIGTPLESTYGGRFLSWLNHDLGIPVSDKIWQWASATFANNATGEATAVIRANGKVWTTIEKPILDSRGIPIKYVP